LPNKHADENDARHAENDLLNMLFEERDAFGLHRFFLHFCTHVL
jgi:hypothetical protein